MKIISVNAGSSSLKYKMFLMPEETVLCEGIFERIGQDVGTLKFIKGENKKVMELPLPDHKVAVEKLLSLVIEEKVVESLSEIEGVGHRVVHGGETFKDSVVLTDEVISEIEKVSGLAPLHNPANLTGISSFMEVLPNIVQVAVFDTAFHQTMKPEAYMYPVPYEWYEKYGVRKYGFHGTSHKYVSERVAELMGKRKEEVNVIVAHIGNGASICAVQGGNSIDTTMGLTPLAGIPMGTRSGNVDPALLHFISERENISIGDVTSILNKKSGFIGVSGVSSDNRDLEDAVKDGCDRSQLAMDLQDKAIAGTIAEYAAYLGRVDAICFTAGLGENSIRMREEVARRLSILGVKIDETKNDVRSKEVCISSDDSKISLYIVPTNEELVIARDTVQLS